MASEPVRAGADWLALREPADAAARAPDLVDELRRRLPARGPLRIHDLGCGTGSMARWLAPRLPGPQRWVLHDRDADLLARVATYPVPVAADGSHVQLETRLDDVTRLGPDLADAGLVTASALLDMMNLPELQRFVDDVVAVGCPVLVTLSVVGRVELAPGDPLDAEVAAAFDDHQCRTVGNLPLLGPTAAAVAASLLSRAGMQVTVRPSPWRLGGGEASLVAEWFRGWVAAAVEQRPGLAEAVTPYSRRRLAEAAAGELSVSVHHEDLLALPAGSPGQGQQHRADPVPGLLVRGRGPGAVAQGVQQQRDQ
jgi:hypothetical protein